MWTDRRTRRSSYYLLAILPTRLQMANVSACSDRVRRLGLSVTTRGYRRQASLRLQVQNCITNFFFQWLRGLCRVSYRVFSNFRCQHLSTNDP